MYYLFLFLGGFNFANLIYRVGRVMLDALEWTAKTVRHYQTYIFQPDLTLILDFLKKCLIHDFSYILCCLVQMHPTCTCIGNMLNIHLFCCRCRIYITESWVICNSESLNCLKAKVMLGFVLLAHKRQRVYFLIPFI